MTERPDFDKMSCPLPLMDHDTIQLAHGAGGLLSADLIDKLILPRFASPELNKLEDQAVLDLPPGRLAFSTDTFVVSPIFFPGGDIGDLAINGTVNDVAMSGAEVHRPVAWASCWKRVCPWPTSTGFCVPWKAAAAEGRRAHRHRRHQGGRQGQLRQDLHQHLGRGRHSRGCEPVGGLPRNRAMSSSCRAPWPITAWRS